MRKVYWYFSAYVRKHGLIVLGSLVVTSLALWFVIPLIARTIEQKPRVYIGMVGSYQLNALPAEISTLMGDGLTSIEADGSVIPDLAERWLVEDGGKQYRFLIKKNVVWQDGKSLEPSDLQYQFRDVEVVTTANDIVFKLPDTYAPFPVVVAQPIFRTDTERYWLFFSRPLLIGTGTYQLIDYHQQGNRLRELVLDGPNERRIYRFYITEEEAVLAFKHGQVDQLPNLTASYGLEDWSTVRTQTELNDNRYLAVFFNFDNPLFTKNVRQALSYAIQKPAESQRAHSPINPNSWAYLDGAKTYDYDLPRAVERLLDEPPAQPLELELTTTPAFEAMAEQIKNDWTALGEQAEQQCQTTSSITDKSTCANLKITTTLRVTPFPDTSNFQLLLVGQESPPDPDQYDLWHSGQNTNFSRYKNTRIDSLLERGRQTQDQTERTAIYQEFQQFFLEDAPAIFLQYLPQYQISRGANQ